MLLQVILAELDRGADHLVEIGGHAVGSAAPHERQQVANDLTGARALAADHFEVEPHLRVRPPVQHQLDGADDGLERIVDLVRHAGDQLAHRRQPLAVDELIAERQFVRDVALHADEVREASGRILQPDHGTRGGKRRAVTTAPQQRPAPDASPAHLIADVGAERAEAPFHQVGEAQAAELLAGVAQRADEGLVRVLERAARRA